MCRLSPLLTIVTLVARPPNSRNLASSQTAPVFTCRAVVVHHGHFPVSRITSRDPAALAHPHATLTSKSFPRLSVIEASRGFVAQLAATNSHERPFPGISFPRVTSRPTPTIPMTDVNPKQK